VKWRTKPYAVTVSARPSVLAAFNTIKITVPPRYVRPSTHMLRFAPVASLTVCAPLGPFDPSSTSFTPLQGASQGASPSPQRLVFLSRCSDLRRLLVLLLGLLDDSDRASIEESRRRTEFLSTSPPSTLISHQRQYGSARNSPLSSERALRYQLVDTYFSSARETHGHIVVSPDVAS
jgi:hypothetical protein